MTAMSINLRKARKLESEIYKYEQEMFNNSTGVATPIVLDATQTLKKIEVERIVVKKRIETIEKLHDLRYKIREAIATKNHESGVDSLVTEQKKLTSLVNETYKFTINDRLKHPGSVEDIHIRLESEKLANSSRLSSGNTTITWNSLTDEDQKELKDKVYAAKQRLEAVDSEINYKNLQTHIDLSLEEVAFLRELQLL